MTGLLVLPILIPLVTAGVSLLARRLPAAQRGLGLAGSTALLIASLLLLRAVEREGILVVQIGNWPAPFGITFVADLLSAIMVVLAAAIGFAVVLYSLASVDPGREAFGYYPLYQILLMGVCGAFLTGDIFNLFVWFEVMLVASFVLLALGGERAQMEGAIKYVTLNLVSSVLFLSAVGVLYGSAGTLNMADLAQVLRDARSPGLITSIAMLFLMAFGIKAAMFPLFFWLPASYHTPPVAVSAVFAGLLTKVGVYALLRVFTLIFVQDVAHTHTIILALSGLTMLAGVLGAMVQQEFRRILSFHIVSQIGYMTMGLGLFTRYAVAGSILYIVHHIIVKTNLFLVSGVSQLVHGTGDLDRIGGLYRAYPAVSVFFLIAALSLAGVPPLSGFFAKLALVQAGLAAEQYAIVAVALFVGLLTLYSMTKIWAEAFWKEPAGTPPPDAHRPEAGRLLVPIVFLAGLTLAIGAAAGPVFELALRAADQLMDPSEYIRAVLGGRD
jgi:multicomponent Na+:H+ antiporter subunit D